jgi:hypothetical protein
MRTCGNRRAPRSGHRRGGRRAPRGRPLLRVLRHEPEFAKLVEDEPATFFLTDFLARNFDRLVIKGLGLDRHPELRDQYFGNYQRLVFLAQTDDPALSAAARRAARRLGLRYEQRRTGYGRLATTIAAVAAGKPAPPVTSLLEFGGR